MVSLRHTMFPVMLKDIFRSIGERGRIFTVTFKKRGDGQIRVMNCRLGVKKGVKGTGKGMYDPATLTVYDMQARGFRNISLENVISFKTGGRTFTVLPLDK